MRPAVSRPITDSPKKKAPLTSERGILLQQARRPDERAGTFRHGLDSLAERGAVDQAGSVRGTVGRLFDALPRGGFREQAVDDVDAGLRLGRAAAAARQD